MFASYFNAMDTSSDSGDGYPDYWGNPGFQNMADGYTDDWGYPRYQNMAEKSAAATRREEQAMDKYKQAREQMEKRTDVQPGSKQTVELLKPSCHLVEASWNTFRKHVLSHDGWVAKRRVATEEEKQQHKETRKGKVYFVDVIFTVPQPTVDKWILVPQSTVPKANDAKKPPVNQPVHKSAVPKAIGVKRSVDQAVNKPAVPKAASAKRSVEKEKAVTKPTVPKAKAAKRSLEQAVHKPTIPKANLKAAKKCSLKKAVPKPTVPKAKAAKKRSLEKAVPKPTVPKAKAAKKRSVEKAFPKPKVNAAKKLSAKKTQKKFKKGSVEEAEGKSEAGGSGMPFGKVNIININFN